MKYSFQTLANRIAAQFNWEANGFKLNDKEFEFDDRICFVTGILDDGEAVLSDVVESMENECTSEFTDEELRKLETLINEQL